MGKNSPLDPEKYEPVKDVERYEALQESADQQIKRLSDTYEKHAQLFTWLVTTAMGLATALVLTFGTLGTIFFYRNTNEMKQEMRVDRKEMRDKIQEDTTNMRQLVKQREDQLLDEIDQDLRKRIDQVTTAEIQHIVNQQIDPRLAQIINIFRTMNGDSEAFFRISELAKADTNQAVLSDTIEAAKQSVEVAKQSISDAVLEAQWATKHGTINWTNYNFGFCK